MATKIKVKIAGRMYPLTIKESEEVFIRQASLRIDKMLQNFEENYAVEDKQDALAMCTLQMASLLEKQKAENEERLEQVTSQVNDLEEMTKRALQQK